MCKSNGKPSLLQEEFITLFSKTYRYAVCGMMGLSQHPLGTLGSVREIGQRYGIPTSTLAKIFRKLARAGVLTSVPGRHGGFALCRAPNHISLYEIKTLIDGETLRGCLWQPATCSEQTPCLYHQKWHPLEHDLRQFLKNTTLADLAPFEGFWVT